MSVEAPCATNSTSAVAKPSLDELQREILAAFHGNIKPVQTSLTYRLGILLVAVVMMLLPLLYIAMIGLVCWGVYLHAVHDVGMLAVGSGRGKIMVLIAYLAPMIIGPILILFMFKPLLSRQPKGRKKQYLEPEQEPLVFAFVDRICQAVGAPQPKRIDVDCQVNACASLRRGFLSMFSSDLVLTIGLPLVAGLSTRQLAGVLAHEFGHFAQSAGMRLTYIIRSISHWFTRVVYERDVWDDRLEAWSERLDIRVGWVLYLARLFVWLTRRMLWVLMVVGHAVSGYMLRQMEFDADRNEARLAGSDEFEATSARIMALSFASRNAQSDLTDFYREGRLSDDYPRLVLHNVNQFKADAYAKLNKIVEDGKTGWYDTHPCDKDRIASARREAAPGIFQLEMPATVLFRNFDDTAREMTWVYYRNVLGDDLPRDVMQPLDDLIARQRRDEAGYQALGRFFQGAYRGDRRLPLPEKSVDFPTDPQAAAELLRSNRQRMLAELNDYRQAEKEMDAVDPDRRAEFDDRLLPFETAAALRLHTALDAPSAENAVETSPETRTETTKLIRALQSLDQKLESFVTMTYSNSYLGTLLQQLSQNRDNQSAIYAMRVEMQTTGGLLRDVRGGCLPIPYPFEHAKDTVSVGDYLLDKAPNFENPVEVYYAADGALGNFHRLRAKIIGRLCVRAEEVETSFGLEPLPEPVEEETPAATDDEE